MEIVQLKNGKEIQVLPQEVAVLRKAGLLKEEKDPAETKEEKKTGETKDEKAAMENMKPTQKRPVNISTKNFSKGKK